MAFSEYGLLDGVGLAELVRARQVTPVELVEAAIAAIDRENDATNAVVCKMYEKARHTARGAVSAGPFHGVPFLIKDLDAAVAGERLTFGSRFLSDFIPEHDCTLVARYRAAGLIIVGKTNAPEFGLTPFTEPRLWGPSHTPWKRGYTAGGSSGGSAAAVAAGMVPMAHGGDGGGSLRIPASCCGVFGFKPSRGRAPVGPTRSEIWSGLAVEHGITRSVRDSAALLDTIVGFDADARFHLPPPVQPFLSEVGADPGRMRIAVTQRPHLPGTLHADCARAVEDAAALLESLGHTIEQVDLEIDAEGFARDLFLIVCVETAASIAQAETLLGRRGRRGDFETSTWLVATMGRRKGAVAAALAHARLQALTRQVTQASLAFDVLLSPTLGTPPAAIGALLPHGIEATVQEIVARLGLGFVLDLPPVLRDTLHRVFAFTPFTPLANVTGQPSMSVPLYWNDDGLPIGSMFTAGFGEEAKLFRLAAQLEAARPWKARKPPASS